MNKEQKVESAQFAKVSKKGQLDWFTMAQRVDHVKETPCSICLDLFTNCKILVCGHHCCKECIYLLTKMAGLGNPLLCPDCQAQKVGDGLLQQKPKGKHGGVGGAQRSEGTDLCGLHKQPKLIYCFDCGVTICRDCAVSTCCEHNREFVSVAAPKVREEMMEQLEPLKEGHREVLSTVEKYRTEIAKAEDQGRCVKENIETFFAKLKATIDNRKEELLMEAKNKTEKKLELLSEQEKSLTASHDAIQNVIDYTQKCLSGPVDDEVLHMLSGVLNQVALQEQLKDKELLKPVVKADMGVEIDCAEDLKKLCRQMKIVKIPRKGAASTDRPSDAGSVDTDDDGVESPVTGAGRSHTHTK